MPIILHFDWFKFHSGFLGCNLGHEVNDQDSMNIMDFGKISY